MNNILLDLLSFGAILSGILVITSKNPVISVLFLIGVFINVAGYLVILGLGFLGLTYLIIYIGAIAILFIFVIMTLNIKLAELTQAGKEYTKNLPLGIIIGIVFLMELLSLIPLNYNQTYLINFFNTINLYSLNDSNFLHNDNIYFYNQLIYQTQDISWDNNWFNLLHIQSIGQILYTNYILWFILASFILLLAMIGPIILCLKNNQEIRY